MLFIGHTRFSLFDPGSAAWLASNGSMFSSPEQYMEYLYSDDRLALRADIFVNCSLPQLEIASRAHKLKHIVAFSDTLPMKYQTILAEAADRFPFIILERGTEHHKAVLPGTSAWNSMIHSLRGESICFGTYRLDDDDILPVDFFDQMAPHVTPANIGMQVSLGSGIEALYEHDKFVNLRQSYYPMFSAGLTNICGVDSAGTLQQPTPAPHHLSDRTNPVILDSRRIGFMRLRHLTQDGALRNGGFEASDRRQKILTHMNRAPALNPSIKPEAAFPVLAGRFDFTEALPTDKDIAGPRNLSANPIVIPVDTDKQALKVSILLQCSSEASDRNALLSLDLQTNNSDKLDSGDHLEHFRAQGISHSSIPGIGFFRYLKTKPGRVNSTVSIELPEGVVCRSISLRRWKNHTTKIDICNVHVSSV